MNGSKDKKMLQTLKKMTHWSANNQKFCRKNIFTESMILYLTENIEWAHNEWFEKQKNVADFKKGHIGQQTTKNCVEKIFSQHQEHSIWIAWFFFQKTDFDIFYQNSWTDLNNEYKDLNYRFTNLQFTKLISNWKRNIRWDHNEWFKRQKISQTLKKWHIVKQPKIVGKNIFTASAIAFLMLASNNRVK